MMGWRLKLIISSGLVVLGALCVQQVLVSAQGVSPSYRIDESFIGPGSQLESGSTNYTVEAGQQSAGNTGVVEGASTNYKTQGGATTTSDPYLRCSVNAASLNFGALSIATTATATATFSVLNYTAYGYNVSVIGNTPVNSGYNLASMGSNAASSTGTEQFGINLIANTNPTILGSNPVQIPDSTFSFGTAATNYNTTNSYRYVSGETIATAPKSSGQTNFTISYIINASASTPTGAYNGNQVIVCTGTY